MLTKALRVLDKQDKPIILLIGAILVCLIGGLNFIASYEISFAVFYVFPIFIVTWFIGKNVGYLVALTSCLVWFIADKTNGHQYSHHLIPVWNMLIRLTFYSIIVLLVSALCKATKREAALARIDYLTGAINYRSFYDLAQKEINRLERYKHPFTLAYIDLDNFKILNDQFGHNVGDQALCTIVKSAEENMRKTDIFARLGGDEFAMLMPETSQESTQIAIEKLRSSLLKEMQLNNWPITFSIGVLTCNTAPSSVKDLVKMADELMYSVKNTGRNSVKYATYNG